MKANQRYMSSLIPNLYSSDDSIQQSVGYKKLVCIINYAAHIMIHGKSESTSFQGCLSFLSSGVAETERETLVLFCYVPNNLRGC